MRLTTRGATTFELDPDSYSKMMMEVRELMAELIATQLSTDMIEKVTYQVLKTIDTEHIAQRMAMNLDYSRVIEYARNSLFNRLNADERFNNRVMRLINEATIGVTNEAVERITALIEAKSNNNSDL